VKVFTVIAVAALGVLPLGLNRAQAGPSLLPLGVSAPEWRPLSQRQDQGLQARLDLALKQHASWQPLLAQGKMSVGLVDLSNPKAPRAALVNGNTMMYGASLPKLMVLLAAFQGFEDGSLKDTREVHRDLIEMIRRSDNLAASRVIGRIGLRKIEALAGDRRYRFYDPKKGGIWLGGTYAHGGEKNPEPITGLSHTATAYQLCRFYYLLAYGRLVSPERSGQMLKILAFPDLPGKFVSVLEKSVPPNYLYRKSGEVRGFHADSILVWGEAAWQRYILVSMIDDAGGEKILKDLVPVAEAVLRPSRPLRSGEIKKKTPSRRAGK
jgi:beta-lactamase class A